VSVTDRPEDFVVATVLRDPWRRRVLEHVRSLELSDGWVAAGFVRSAVWDRLSGKRTATPLPDVDVIYFDPDDTARPSEETIRRKLEEMAPGVPWSVKNQARMHTRNGDAPYASTEDAMWHWAETATCVAVRLDESGNCRLLAPHGLDDLMAMRIRPTPHFMTKLDTFRARARRKDWRALWPGVAVREY
jgi:hypothetical protein